MKHNYLKALIYSLSILSVTFGFSETIFLKTKNENKNSHKKEVASTSDFSKNLKESTTTDSKTVNTTTKKRVVKSEKPKNQKAKLLEPQNNFAWTLADTCPTCDFDGDGIANNVDIDDDNDGVLDETEANCGMQAATKAGVTVSKPANVGFSTVNSGLAGLVNNVEDISISTPSGTLNNNEWFRLTFPTAIALTSWEISHTSGQTLFTTTSTYKVQGSNDATNWTDLTGTLTYSNNQGNLGPYTGGNVASFPNNTTAYLYYRYYGISGASGGGFATEFYYTEKYCPTPDTDGDGFTNQFDLDSDNDGCSDARESAATASTTANYSFSGAVGTNGLVNSLETATDSGVLNYTNTFMAYAISNKVNLCSDNDADGIIDLVDIDDDNDGVLDNLECSSLYPPASLNSVHPSSATTDYNVGATIPYGQIRVRQYKAAAISSGTPFDSYLGWPYRSDLPSNGYFNVNKVNVSSYFTDSFEAPPVANVNNQDFGYEYLFWLEAGTYTVCVEWDDSYSLAYSTTGNYKDMILIKDQAYGSTGIAYSTMIFSLPQRALMEFRATDINGIRQTIDIFGFVDANGACQSGVKLTDVFAANAVISCDTDNDGIPNNLDLDSDGDGCPDAKESGVSGTLLSGNSIAQGPYGSNGLANSLENNDTAAATTSYTNGYGTYAISAAKSECADVDADGVNDTLDIDSDNDGILNTTESPTCYYTATESAVIKSITSQLFVLSYPAYKVTNLIDGSASTTNAFLVQDWVGKEIYNIVATNALPISGVSFDLSGVYSNTGSDTFKLQGSADTTGWVDLSAPVISTGSTGTFILSNTLQPNTPYKYYRVIGVAGSSGNATTKEVHLIPAASYVTALNPKPTCTFDTDGDGVVNHLDLDSDGDGCPDAKESGVSGTLLSGNVVNGTPNTTVSTANAIAQGPYGSNGLANGVESNDTTTASVTFTNTYCSYAIYKLLNVCADSDGDGVGDLVDIDMDNDGILNVAESPSCFYTAAEMAIPFKVTTEITNTDVIANLYDNTIATTFAFPSTLAANAKDKTIFEITPIYPQVATSIILNVTSASPIGALNTTIAQVLAQGWDGTTWVTLATYSTLPTVTTNIQTFAFTNTTPYSKYRLFDTGSTGAALNINTTREVSLGFPASYVQGINPKPTCAVDSDGDGIPNHLDLDSDGDGCPDAKEAAVTGTLLAGNVVNGTPNTTTSIGNAVAQGPYGTNGLANSLENNDTTAATTSFVSTYNRYAIFKFLNLCADTDADGVADMGGDLDNDNDGVLNATEAPSCYYTATEMAVPYVVTTELASADPIANVYDNNLSTTFSFTATTALLALGKTIFEITPIYPQVATSIVLKLNTAASPIGTYLLSAFLTAQGWDGTTWVTLGTYLVAPPVVNNSQTFSFTNSTPYTKYRLFEAGVGVAITNSVIREVALGFPANYSPSANPKPTCSIDSDNDGIPNTLDLDSDNDGCPDIYEAQVPGYTATSTTVTGSVGTNGFANALETATDSNFPNTTTFTNYYIYYQFYAVSNTLSFCTDIDGDGVKDVVDVDTDNDGIVNAIESPSCFYTPDAVTLTSDFTTSASLSLLIDKDVSTTLDFAPNQAVAVGQSVFKLGFARPVTLSSIILNNRLGDGSTYNPPFVDVYGSLDGINYQKLTSTAIKPSVAGTTGTVTITLDQNLGDYLYYDVRAATTGTLYTIFNLGEIYYTPVNYVASKYPKETCTVDPDNDTLPNYKDLDSDGDGCYDIVESQVPGYTIGSTTTTGTVGANGYANALETAVDSGIQNFTNYYIYAQSNFISACSDFDNDGIKDIVDIDDDNDGILDATESASCFYTGAEMISMATIRTDLNLNPTYPLTNATDGSAATEMRTTADYQDWVGLAIIEYDLPDFVKVDNLVLTGNYLTNATDSFQLEGWNGSAWIPLSTAVTNSSTANQTVTLTNTLSTNGVFNKIRVAGATGFTRLNGQRIFEVTLNLTSTYNASSHQKSSCSADVDNDTHYNHLDLDSDNDSCPDIFEAQITGYTSASTTVTGTVGTNGFADALETATDSGLPSTTTFNEYVRYYPYYALNSNYNFCTDSDADGVKNLVDLDDDNDGIIDAIEAPSCYYTATEMGIPTLVTTEMTNTGTLTNLNDNNVATTFAFPTTSAANAVGKTIFELTPAFPQVATSIVLNVTSASPIGALNGTIAQVLAQGWDGTNWVILATFSALPTVTTNIQSFAFTNTTSYLKYRLFDTGSTGATLNTNTVREVSLGFPATYMPSLNPKPTCTVDTDGDGIKNTSDLDSDNDGCSDAFEAGVTVLSGVSMTTNNTIVAAPYGANGLADSVETAAESGVYKGTYTYANATNNTVYSCPCPTITATATNPTTCGGSDGTIKLCGLIPNKGANIVTYVKNGGGTTIVDELLCDASGCVTLTGLSAGNYTNIKVITLSCTGTTAVTATIIGTAPNAGTLSGTQNICGTGTTTFTSNGDAGGSWTSSNTAIATVNSSGVVSAVAMGTATITYTVAGIAPCTNVTATRNVTVTQDTVAGTITSDQTICVGETPVAIALAGNIGNVLKWQKASNAAFTSPTDIANTTTTLSSVDIGALTTTTYFRAVVQSGSCSVLNTNTVTITVPSSTWNGSAWSNGIPTIGTTAIFTGNYSSASDLFACSVTVTNNATVVINTGNDYTVHGKVTVDTGSTFRFENDANLIQITNVQNSGNIIVKRNTIALSRLDYKLWASPVMPQQLLAFTPQTLTNRFYTYNSAISNYSTVAATGNFELGKGYLIRMPDNFPTYPATSIFNGSFTGVPNNGEIIVPISNSGDKFSSIGNPYPSTFNPMTFVTTNSNNITGTLYIWRKRNNTNYLPGYITWAGGTMTGNGEPGTFTGGLDYFQIGQGFIVESKNGASSVLFNNLMRSGNNEGISFKNTNTIEYNRIWLNLTSTTTTEFNQMAVGYITGATLDVDIFDGRNINNSTVLLCSIINNENYTIQGRPLPFIDTDIVPLFYKVTTAGNYTITINQVDGLFASGTQNIFIKDNLTNTYNNLNTNPYTFASDAGSFNNRFELVYRDASLATNTFTNNQVVVYKNNDDIVINTGNIQMAKVKIFDVRGRLLAEKKNINAIETQMKASVANEVLLIQITVQNGTTVTKKLIN